jgi:membrane protein
MAASTESQKHLFAQLKDVPFRELGKRFIHEFKEDDLMGAASEVAYHLIFAIPPLLILTVTVAAAMNRFTTVPVEGTLRDLVNERAPENVQEVLNTIITNAVSEVSGGLLSIGLLTTAAVAIWSGSNGIAAIMKAYNRAYDVEEGRPYLRKRLVAAGLTILLVVIVNVAIALSIFGESLGAGIATWLGMGDAFRSAWDLARWPAAILMFMFLLAMLYYLAPAVEQSFHWISPGSVVATILWIGALFGFRIYLNYASPGTTYGAFSSLVVFLFFLYITSIVLLIGAEINAILQKRYDEAVVRDRAEHPERLTSPEAQQEAAGEARGMEQREGRPLRNRAAEADDQREQTSQTKSPPPRRGALGWIGLATAGTIAGWLLGHRAGLRANVTGADAHRDR